MIADFSLPNWYESRAKPTQVNASPNKLTDSAKYRTAKTRFFSTRNDFENRPKILSAAIKYHSLYSQTILVVLVSICPVYNLDSRMNDRKLVLQMLSDVLEDFIISGMFGHQ